MKRYKRTKLPLALLSLIALLIVTAGTASASDGQSGLFGKVVAVTEDGLLVETKNGEVDVAVTGDTEYRAPEHDSAALNDISEGDRIAVVVSHKDDATIAVSVMFVPSHGKVLHITGVVAEVAEGTAVLITEDGQQITVEFGLNGNIVDAGAVVTIVGRLDAETGVLRARSVHLVDKTLRRLRAHVEEIREAALERKDQIKHVARVQHLLEEASSRQLKIVSELLDRLPEEAHAGLERALSNIEEANRAIAEALDTALELAGRQERERQQVKRLTVQRLPKEMKPTFQDVAAALNTTTDALAEQLRQDITLAQIVEDAGLTGEAFVQKVIDVVVERLQPWVDEGRLTQEALDLIADELHTRAEEAIEEIFTRDDDVRLDIPFSLEDLAAILEMEPAKLYALFREEQVTILGIAEERGLSRDALVEKLMELARQRAQALLDTGAIGPKDVERLLADMGERIRKQIEKSVQRNLNPAVDESGRGEPDRPDRPDVSSVRASFDLALTARILGMSEDALLARLKEGGTLSDIAQQSGVGLDDLVDKLIEAMMRKLEEMVEEGRIEPDRARELLQEARERLMKSIREFRQETIDRPDQRPAWSPTARLYKNIPVTAEDVAGAFGITVAELQKWMHQDDGVRLLLEERGIDPEQLVAKLLSVAEDRLAELASRNELTEEQAVRLLAELKRRLIADLRLTKTARPNVSDERREAQPTAFVPFNIGILAGSLGLSAEELRRALSSGATVAEIAESVNVSLDQVLRALLQPLEEQIREAIENGRINEDDANEKLEEARESTLKGLRSFHLPEQNRVRPVVRPAQPPEPRPLPDISTGGVSLLARALGTSLDEFRDLIARGQAVAEIVKRMGLTREEMVRNALASQQDALREAVRSGRISDEEARKRLEAARDEIIQALRSLLDVEGSGPSIRDQGGDSSTTSGSDVLPEDRVIEPVVNRPPAALIVVGQTGTVGDSVLLDGSGSQDDGVIKAFSWRQIEGPRTVLSDTSSAVVSFLPVEAGTYVFELVVADDQGLSSVAVTVTVVVDEPQRGSLNTDATDTGTSSNDDGSPDTNRQVSSGEQDKEDVAAAAA
ncbi:MAG: hypothetical protein O7F09_07395 [Chloroflexi bacterium]|nr:hypothetical protein [Chloroflexota bacterium]